MDVSIIIVNYNTCDLLRNCLVSIFEKTNDITFEVIVSDNGSIDGSVEMIRNNFPKVIIIENKENLGFGAANNRGLAIAKGKYIFYLNSDTVLLNNAVKLFFDYWENSNEKEKIGALGTNLIDANANITHSYDYFPSFTILAKKLLRRNIVIIFKFFCELFNIQYKIKNKKYSLYQGEVEYITGADLFMKNNKNALYDERYFLYAEECDLEYKLYKLSLKRLIILGPEIIHFQGCSDNISSKTLANTYASFGKIQMDISNVKFIAYQKGYMSAFFIKILTTIAWLNPLLFTKTKGYLKTLWSI